MQNSAAISLSMLAIIAGSFIPSTAFATNLDQLQNHVTELDKVCAQRAQKFICDAAKSAQETLYKAKLDYQLVQQLIAFERVNGYRLPLNEYDQLHYWLLANGEESVTDEDAITIKQYEQLDWRFIHAWAAQLLVAMGPDKAESENVKFFTFQKQRYSILTGRRI